MALKPYTLRVALLLAGIAVGLAVSARSEIAAWRKATPTPDCDDLRTAISSAVNNNVRLVALTSPDPGKYFSAASPDSCLSGLAVANLDLSRLVPDPLGLLSVGVEGVIDELKKAALGAACVAARNAVSDTIGKYNRAIASTTDGHGLIDAAIGDASRQMLDAYAMNWKTPQSSGVLAGVKSPGNVVPLAPTMKQTVPTQLPAPASSQPQSSPAGLGAAVFGR